MKSNIIKYVFGLIVLGLIIFSIYKLYLEKDVDKNKDIMQNNIVVEENIITDLRLGVYSFDTINPIISNNKNVQEISTLIYEPLLKIDENYKIELCLAKEWSKTSATSYLIKLKEDVKWENNTKLTAKDVQYTIDLLKANEISSIYEYNVENVISVEVIDEYTIKINLDKEVPFFEYNLTFPIMSYNYYINKDFKKEQPIGTGRYKISENNNQNIILIKNENWWNIKNEDAKITKIKIRKYESIGEVYNAFKIGSIDLLTTSNTNLKEYIGTIGYNIKEYRGRQLDFIAINTESKILSNVEVRQAINYAIDKQNIISRVYNNKYFISNFALDFGSYIYNQDVQYEYNQDKAKEILTNNGWIFKNKNWQKTENYKTQKIRLNLVVQASKESRVEVAKIVEEQLENIGIDVNLIKATDSQYQKYLQNKNYDLIISGMYYSYSPDLTTYFGENNLSNYTSEEINNIMNDIKNITEEKVLREKYKRIIEIYKEQLPYIFLYTNTNTLVYSTDLMGDINPNSYNIFNNISGWYRK